MRAFLRVSNHCHLSLLSLSLCLHVSCPLLFRQLSVSYLPTPSPPVSPISFSLLLIYNQNVHVSFGCLPTHFILCSEHPARVRKNSLYLWTDTACLYIWNITANYSSSASPLFLLCAWYILIVLLLFTDGYFICICLFVHAWMETSLSLNSLLLCSIVLVVLVLMVVYDNVVRYCCFVTQALCRSFHEWHFCQLPLLCLTNSWILLPWGGLGDATFCAGLPFTTACVKTDINLSLSLSLSHMSCSVSHYYILFTHFVTCFCNLLFHFIPCCCHSTTLMAQHMCILTFTYPFVVAVSLTVTLYFW